MTHNPNIKKLVFLMLISKVGLTIFSKMNELILIEKGVHKEIISLSTTLNIPIQILLLFTLRNENKTIMTNIINSFFHLIIISFVNLLIFISYDKLILLEFNNVTVILGIVITIVFANVNTVLICSSQSFMNKICDRDIGASYLTAMVSVINISAKWPEFFVFAAIDLFGFKVVGIISILYTFLFYFFSKNSFKDLDELPSEKWKLNDKAKKN